VSTTETETGAKKILATLTRGRVYMLMNGGDGLIFENGKPREVTADQRDYLRDNALDIVSVEGEAEYQPRQKFKFTEVLEAEVPAAIAAATTAPARGRNRA
jgi:hypothetical protein